MIYNIGDTIHDDKRDIIITNKMILKKANQNRNCYQYKCNICGFDCKNFYNGGNYFEKLWVEDYRLEKCGCSCCNGKSVSPNINSVSKLRPDLVKYFHDKLDADKYTLHSSKKVLFDCPQCNLYSKEMTIDKFVNRGFSCPKCSDKLPMGEKMMYLILSELNIVFYKEYSLDNGKHRYDFYLPKENMIIEIHGCQHYKGNFEVFRNGRTLEQEQCSDKEKYNIAVQNGISQYIVVDARQSSFSFIKRSIEKELSQYLDFSNINWSEIMNDCFNRNIIKDVCAYWNKNTTIHLAEMSEIFHLSTVTIREYLKRGNELGWCVFNTIAHTEHYYNPYEYDAPDNTQPIKCVDNNTYFKGSKLCSKLSEEIFGKYIGDTSIRYVLKKAKGKGKKIHLAFEYITKEEFNKAIENGFQCYGSPYCL